MALEASSAIFTVVKQVLRGYCRCRCLLMINKLSCRSPLVPCPHVSQSTVDLIEMILAKCDDRIASLYDEVSSPALHAPLPCAWTACMMGCIAGGKW